MNPIQKFLLWLANVTPQEKVGYPVYEELIKRDKIINAQQQQIQGLKAQIAKSIAEEKEKREEDKQVVYQNILAEKLSDREEEIKSKRFQNNFSLTKLHYKFFHDRELREKLEITDYEDNTVFGKFGEFLIMPNGYFGITTKDGRLVSYGRQLHQVIWKPDSLSNYIKRFRLPIPKDKNMRFVVDYLNEEVPEIYEEKDIKETNNYKQTVKSLLAKRDEALRLKDLALERTEKAFIELRANQSETQRKINVLQSERDFAKAQLTKINKDMEKAEKNRQELEGEIANIRELKKVSDDINVKYRGIIYRLLEKIEYYGDKDTFFKVKEMLKGDIRFYSEFFTGSPPQEEPQQISIAQPGQVLPKTK